MANIRFFLNEDMQDISSKLHGDVVRKIADILPDEDAGHLAEACKTFHRQTAPARQAKFKKRMQEFLHAVINDDRTAVKNLLDRYPKLLLAIPPSDLVIESQCTWQKFYAEDALTMAVKLKQIKMTQLLLSYYDKLPQTKDVITTKEQALSACKLYEMQRNANGEDEIVIPEDYARLAQSLVDVFREEKFPNGVPGVNKIPRNIELSVPTELELTHLLDRLVPRAVVKLDEHIDVELLQLAVYKAYVKNFSSFNYDWGKLDALCIRVMGLIKTALIPETGEICCESLYDVVTAMERGEEREISPLAAAHKLKGGEEFYRSSRDSRVGQGFEFLCDFDGGAAGRGAGLRLGTGCEVRGWKDYVEQKQQVFGILCGKCSNSKTHSM
jgi:hypothetical protein